MQPIPSLTLPATAVEFMVVVAVAAALVQPLTAATLPPSLTAAPVLGSLPQTVVPSLIDHATLLAEDENATALRRGAPVRFATPVTTSLSADDSGRWDDLGDGRLLWRAHIVSPRATSLNLWISELQLPPGAALWLHDPAGGQLHGPYTGEDLRGSRELWTPVIVGDELVVEAVVPALSRTAFSAQIARVHHGYRFFGSPSSMAKQGSCNIDVICPEGEPWRDEIRSVARYTISGMYLCTGTLMNNTAEDLRPLFLSANHCEVNESTDHTTVFYWNYESPSCGLLSGGSLRDSQNGATYLASWNWDDNGSPVGSDFVLLELATIPDEAFNVYYAGWDVSGLPPQGVVSIHQPNGDEKAISFESNTLGTIWGTHWVIPDWDLGTTEQGSSGSCLYDAGSGRCIGTLSGGYASCSNPTGDDWYGKLSEGWEGDGTAGGRLREHLDPLASGAIFVDGLDPNGGGISYDNVWLVPAAASTPGYGGANWKSEITIVNHSTATRTATVYFVAAGAAWPGEQLGGPYTIAPHATMYLDDPLLPSYPTSGLVFVTTDLPGPLVSSRTFSIATGGATYGQGIPGIELAAVTTPSELILPLARSEPGRFHSNLGLVQTGNAAYAVEITVFSAIGSPLAQTTYTQTSAFRQINDLFGDLGLASQSITGGWVRARLVGGSPAFWTAYLSVIDDLSHDPTFIAGVAP